MTGSQAYPNRQVTGIAAIVAIAAAMTTAVAAVAFGRTWLALLSLHCHSPTTPPAVALASIGEALVKLSYH